MGAEQRAYPQQPFLKRQPMQDTGFALPVRVISLTHGYGSAS